MEFSDRFIQNMTRPFWVTGSTFLGLNLGDNITLDNSRVFSKNLIVDITGNDIEVPVIARELYEKIIYDTLIYGNIEKVILPLYTGRIILGRRTFDSIMKEFFCRVPFSQRLAKIVTPKGETYYGGLGLILDEGFNPLLMCGLKARKVVTKKDDNVEDVSMQYYRAVCHVSPTVFAEPDKLVNKGIIKKLIPLYTTTDINFPYVIGRIFHTVAESRKVEVIIDDFSKFFISPIAPTPSKCSNDALNKCLNNNIEDILCLI